MSFKLALGLAYFVNIKIFLISSQVIGQVDNKFIACEIEQGKSKVKGKRYPNLKSNELF